MTTRVTSLLLAAAVPVLAPAAQAPVPTPVPPAAQEPAPKPPAATPPQDPTNAAAELLRRRLGLQNGPQGQPPAGPPIKPPTPPAEPPAAAPDAPAAATSPNVAPVTQEPSPAAAPPAQDPKPPQPVDPTKAAADALRRLLPNAKPPASAPIQGPSGTPEPLAPGQTVATAPPPATPPPPPTGLAWRGTLATRYRGRHGDGATDQDLTARLNLDFGLAERDPFTFHFAGRGFADLDGRRADDPFLGLDQSLGNDVNARLYAAHLDAHRLPHVDLLRLGRQDLDETPTPVTLDGVRADSERFTNAKLYLSAYSGIPVHHFEASRHDDLVYGVAGGGQPWHAARVRLDWMSLRDEFLATDRHDELLGVRWWQNLQDLQLHGLHTWRDGKPRDLGLGLRGELGLPLTFRADYRELLTTQGAQVTELDPFYSIALDYAPYRQIEGALSRDFGDHLTVNVGGELRRLQDSGDEGSFNREFERTHADVTLRDLGAKGLSLALGGSVWKSSGDTFRTVTGDLEYRPDPSLRFVLGTGYDLFRFDAFLADEQVHVRSYYLRSDWRLGKAVRGDAGYEYEQADDGEFHQFRLGVTWTF